VSRTFSISLTWITLAASFPIATSDPREYFLACPRKFFPRERINNNKTSVPVHLSVKKTAIPVNQACKHMHPPLRSRQVAALIHDQKLNHPSGDRAQTPHCHPYLITFSEQSEEATRRVDVLLACY
jgi:hypothetical protein